MNIPKNFIAYGNALTLIGGQANAGTLSIKTLSAAVDGLSQKQIANIAIMNQDLILTKMRTKENIAAYLAKRGLTGAILEETTAQIVNANAKKLNIVATLKQAAANIFSATAWKGLGASILSATKALLANVAVFAAAHPIIAAVGIAIASAAGIYNAYKAGTEASSKAIAEQSEKLTQSKNKFEELKDKAQSTTEQLKETNERMVELQAKETLSLVEQAELERLQAINRELKLTKGLLDVEMSQAQTQMSKDAQNLHTELNKTSVGLSDAIPKIGEVAAIIGGGLLMLAGSAAWLSTAGLSTPVIASGGAMAAGGVASYSTRIATTQDSYQDADLDKNIEKYRQYKEAIEGATNAKERDRNKNKLDDTEQKIVDRLREHQKLVAQLSIIENKTENENRMLGESLDAIEAILKLLNHGAWKESKFLEMLNSVEFKDVVEELIPLAKTGELAAEKLSDSRYREFVDTLNDIGISASEATGSLNQMYHTEPPIVKTYNELQLELRDQINLVSTAMREQSDSGNISRRTYDLLSEKGEDYRNLLIETSDGYALASDKAEDFINGLVRQAIQQGISIGLTEEQLDSLRRYFVSVETLSDKLKELSSSFSTVQKAQEEMLSDGGLSNSTVTQIMDELTTKGLNYLDYLYEENGLIKLNVEAYKELALAKMQATMEDLSNDRVHYETQIEFYKELIREIEKGTEKGKDFVATYNFTSLDMTPIEHLNYEIQTVGETLNQTNREMAILEAIVDSIVNTTSGFQDVIKIIDEYSNKMSSLASIQDALSKGFTITLEQAKDFAAVYPEILHNAIATADGQITLNGDVARSFIEMQHAILEADMDLMIAKLEAEKAVLEGKKESAEAQLELVNALASGEIDINNAKVEMLAAAEQTLAQYLMDLGVEVVDAQKAAAEAMAGNMEEYSKIVGDVADTNANNLADSMVAAAKATKSNISNMVQSLHALGQQSRNVAKQIKSMMSGEETYTGPVDVGGGGSPGANFSSTSNSGIFTGVDSSSADVIASTLNEWTKTLELDISTYSDAIAGINGQIAVLEAIRNAPLSNFKSSGSGSNSSGGSSNKEAEPYLAELATLKILEARLQEINNLLDKNRKAFENAGSDAYLKADLLQKQLVLLEEQQKVLSGISVINRDIMKEGLSKLSEHGIRIQFNPELNTLEFEQSVEEMQWIINNVSIGNQEETNEVRKELEAMLDTLISMNDANAKNAAQWEDIRRTVTEVNLDALNLNFSSDINAANRELEQLNFELKMLADNDFDRKMELTNRQLETQQSIVARNSQQFQVLQQALLDGKITSDQFVISTDELTRSMQSSSIAAKELADSIAQIELTQLNQQVAAQMELVNMVKQMIQQEAKNDVDKLNSDLKDIQARQKALKDMEKDLNDALKDRNKLRSDEIKRLDDALKIERDRAKEAKQALDDQLKAYKEIIDLRRKMLQNEFEERRFEQDLTQKQLEVQKVQDRLHELANNDSLAARAERAKLEEDLSKRKLDLDNLIFDNDIKNQDRALQDELDKYTKANQAQKDAIDGALDAYERGHQARLDMIDRERQAHEEAVNREIDDIHRRSEVFDKQADNIRDQIDDIQKRIANNGELTRLAMNRIDERKEEIYKDLVEWNHIYGTGIREDVSKAWEEYLRVVNDDGQSTLKNVRLAMGRILDIQGEMIKKQREMNDAASQLVPMSLTGAYQPGVRDYFENQGYSVDWDDATKFFSVDGMAFDSRDFVNLDGRLQATYEQLLGLERQLTRLPSYDVGGYIDRDQVAIVHKDERVLTPEQNKLWESGKLTPLSVQQL